MSVTVKRVMAIYWKALCMCVAVDGTGGGPIDMPDDYGSRQPSGGTCEIFILVAATVFCFCCKFKCTLNELSCFGPVHHYLIAVYH